MAGVSTATVSRVINGTENVLDETKSRVLSAISRLKYSPDVHAVELRRGKGGVPRKRGIPRLALAHSEGEVRSVREVDVQKQRQKAERLRILEDENARLKRLVTNLSIDVEKWRRVAE